jgi:predicted CopG family antitoxin
MRLKRLNVEVDDKVYEKLKIKVIKDKTTISEKVRELIQKYLGGEGK